MDKYKRSRNQWFAIANGEPMDGNGSNNSNKVERKKTAIEVCLRFIYFFLFPHKVESSEWLDEIDN